MSKRIYLAGPSVFEADPLAEAQRLKVLCGRYGLEGVYPMDAHLALGGLTKAEAAGAIYRANIAFIDQADGMIADMRPFRGPGMDGGTAFEMGYGRARGIPVIGYGLTSTYIERCQQGFGPLYQQGGLFFDGDNLQVEDFGLVDNLMMACGASALVEDAESALQLMAQILKS